ncbi:cytosine/adenosine deaminase-related metal-dependent hydrolase [Brevibacterium sanguinis]|uniref:Cytosine/adenosine deaminase-related metal-dependent hydrolase n=2 Tax=Brevibacterium TaxID=1696 RepID=A0A366IIC0_9MICO|nr:MULTISPECIES: amidohydrolase family protein [Brevibacterium]RBP61973.1 cytosine/adenosine deaminase-related metal-dependent hydrolase [Brevibacterium sanguinis]RBP70605.1 cytosine/adenosine deaminase-related metal-dependent hydrolase [Brevibacterium celere]
MTQLRTLHEAPTLLIPDQVLLPTGAQSGHAVLVDGGRIAAVGPVEAVAAEAPAGVARVELPNRLLMPGFVDAHHHLTQTFGKSLVFGEPSEIFQRVWVPMEKHMDAEAVEVATHLAAWESLRGGFTTVADAGTRAGVDVSAIADVTSAVGLRCVLGVICNDLGGGGRTTDLAEVVAAAERHLSRWDADGLVHPSVAISIPEAATDDALVVITSLAREAGVPFQTHLNEHLAAVERSLVASGERPLERLARLSALGPELLAAHATLLTPREIRLLGEAGSAISYNPVASSWKGNSVAPALLMHELGMRVGLGTDGTRSDAFRLLDAAETAQRLTWGMDVGDSSSGGGWTWLEQGLRGGADAVGLAGSIGEIAVGAHADLLVVNLGVPEFVPSWDVPWELVRIANRDQIDAVIVAGRLRLEGGWPVDWDGQALLDRAREVSERVVSNSSITLVDPPASTHRETWMNER